MNKNSVIIYEGPSRIDGGPIVVIATGLKAPSKNDKTGRMVQTYILRADIHPYEASINGLDASICGSCWFRYDPETGKRVCYVVPTKEPGAIWKAYKRGSYRKATYGDLVAIFAGRKVRLGSYGDPCAVPLEVWHSVLRKTIFNTGYTHQWRNELDNSPYKAFLMASCELAMDVRAAEKNGWRGFWARRADDPTLDGSESAYMECPAAKVNRPTNKHGVPVTCESCGACGGNGSSCKRHVVENLK